MSVLSWLGKTKKTEGCRSHWRPLGGISEHFTGLFRLTFISIARDGSLQSVLTLWPLPLFALSLEFFENSKRWNVSQIWKYYFRLSSLPGSRKVRVCWLEQRTYKVRFEQYFCQGCQEEIVLLEGGLFFLEATTTAKVITFFFQHHTHNCRCLTLKPCVWICENQC